MTRRLIILGIFFTFVFELAAQQKLADSLSLTIKKLDRQSGNRKDTSFVRLLNACANAYSFFNQDSCQLLANRAYRLAQTLNYTKGQGEALQIIGTSLYSKGEIDQALETLDQALQTSDAADDLAGQALATRRIGAVYGYLSKQNRAIDYFLRALRIEQQLKNPQGICVCLNNLGVSFRHLKQYQKANGYLFQGLAIAKKEGFENELALIHTNLGLNFLEQNQYKRALEYIPTAIEINTRLNRISFLARDYHAMGLAYRRLNNSEKARFYFQKSLGYAEPSKNLNIQALVKVNLAEMVLEGGNVQEALSLAESSFQIANDNQRLEEAQQAADVLHKIYKRQGNFAKSLAFKEINTTLKDSLFNQENERRLAELEARFEFEQMEKELKLQQERRDLVSEKRIQQQRWWTTILILALLLSGLTIYFTQRSRQTKDRALQLLNAKTEEISRQQAELEQKNAELEELNSVKTRIFSIVSQDLRSPLSLLQDILKLVNEGDYSEEEFKALIPQLAKNVSTTNNLVENLLSWAHSQLEGVQVQRESFDLQNLALESIHHMKLQARDKAVELAYDSVSIPLSVFADKEMVGLVLKNLIDNALKFSPQGKRVSLQHEVKLEEVILSVKDQGGGISRDRMSKLFDKVSSTPGTRNEKGVGLGLILCKDFIEKNGGRIWAHSDSGSGATFYFSLPRSA
jgi:two-component system, sensor histidine kinase and response regulator